VRLTDYAKEATGQCLRHNTTVCSQQYPHVLGRCAVPPQFLVVLSMDCPYDPSLSRMLTCCIVRDGHGLLVKQ